LYTLYFNRKRRRCSPIHSCRNPMESTRIR